MRSRGFPAKYLAIAGVTCLLAGHAMAAELQPQTVRAWDRYVRLTEQRIERDLEGVDSSLVSEAISSNQIVVTSLETLDETGNEIPVPKGMIHHWRGAILIPNILLEPALPVIKNPLNREDYYQDVLESGLLEKGQDVERIYLKLRRTQAMIEAAYNTEHRVEYRKHSETFTSSRSISTRIAEIVDLGKDTEHEKPEGDDRGFLWRLNAYWKFRQVEEGVLVECETLTLSRSVPFVLRLIIGPFITGTARTSVVQTLESLRTQVLNGLSLEETP